MRRVYGMKVVRLTLGGLRSCPDYGSELPVSRGNGMGLQKSAEAIVVWLDRLDCQSAFNLDPLSASNFDPLSVELARRCVALI